MTEENNYINYERLPWQIDCDEVIKDKREVILSSPTGTGKTNRYEIWALNKKERPIFVTAPLKSLSNQRYREFQAKGYNVGIETGDIKYIPNDNCEIICCTQEIYNKKYRNVENCTLIIDEFSYIFENDDRSRAYIDSLYYSNATNIMLLSATFGNSEEIKNYVNKVTNRDFFLYENKDRITELEYRSEIKKEDIKNSLVVTFSRENCKVIATVIYNDRLEQDKKQPKVDKNKRRREIISIAKKYGVNNPDLFKLVKRGVAYYYGTLLPKEKMFIEELFENKIIDTIVGTDALSMGVNFPIENVVFTTLKKGSKGSALEISKNLFDQLSGRAGRIGYFSKGYVYYCGDFNHYLSKYEKIRNQISKSGLEVSYYYLTSAENERVSVRIKENIKDILSGKYTIEREAKFIKEYSTMERDLDYEMDRIQKVIEYVKTFDLAKYYFKTNFPNVDFSLGYYEATKNLKPETKEKIDKLVTRFGMLQPFFERDISEVYFDEFTPYINCAVFCDILLCEPLQKLIKKYGHSFNDILHLRVYMKQLPKKYLDEYDMDEFDEIINEMDSFALNLDGNYEIKNNALEIAQKIEEKHKEEEQKVVFSPEKRIKLDVVFKYFDFILVDNKIYIKLGIHDNKLLVCNYCFYRDDGNFGYVNNDNFYLKYLPLNTLYKIKGVANKNTVLNCLSVIKTNTSAFNKSVKIEQDVYSIIDSLEYSMKNSQQDIHKAKPRTKIKKKKKVKYVY